MKFLFFFFLIQKKSIINVSKYCSTTWIMRTERMKVYILVSRNGFSSEINNWINKKISRSSHQKKKEKRKESDRL